MKLHSNFSMKWAGTPALALGLTVACAPQSEAELIVNGDFETGDYTGWTTSGAGGDFGNTIDSTTPLAGLHSARQVQSASSQLTQAFTAQTVEVTTSFIFNVTDPGGAGDRSFNPYIRGSAGMINIRVVDLDADGDGDVQSFSGASWVTVLPNAVTFGADTTFSLTINGYGANFSYDLNVGGNIATGLTTASSALVDFDEISFVNSGFATGSSAEIDNVSAVAVPEPGSLALLGLGGLLIARRRRD